MPVAVENIGLVVNTKLAKVPTTFKQLETEALASRRRSTSRFGIAVQQGSGGDAYHMYPFFSGLGGYIFGTNNAGNLDPSDIGVANPTFLKNAPLIDKWNKEGLINSKVDGAAAQNAFLKGQAAFWITGPWNSDTLKKSGIEVQGHPDAGDREAVGAVPRRPGLHGHEVRDRRTASAARHRPRDELLRDAVGADAARAANGRAAGEHQGALDRPGPRAVLGCVEGRRPDAEHPADELRLGRPRPGVGQVDEGSGATPAAVAFKAAARSIADKIG